MTIKVVLFSFYKEKHTQHIKRTKIKSVKTTAPMEHYLFTKILFLIWPKIILSTFIPVIAISVSVAPDKLPFLASSFFWGGKHENAFWIFCVNICLSIIIFVFARLSTSFRSFHLFLIFFWLPGEAKKKKIIPRLLPAKLLRLAGHTQSVVVAKNESLRRQEGSIVPRFSTGRNF